MVLENKLKFILASQSPRRKELLGWLDIPFEVIVPHTDEISSHTNPKDIAIDIAEQKSAAVWEDLTEKTEYKGQYPFVLSSDTIVCLADKIYGKPDDKADARRILLELSGKEHTVVTGVSMSMLNPKTNQREFRSFAVETNVTFDSINEEILDKYILTGESLDKAGAYGIQGKGLTFISHVNGSYSNVVGFPLSHFVAELQAFLKLKGDQKWSDFFVC